MILTSRKVSIVIGVFLLIGIFGYLLAHAPLAHASFLNDWLESATKIFKTEESKKTLTLESNIELVPDGDIDKNDAVDSGDIISFTYIISNPTDKELPFATLKTHVPRNLLNFIHQVQGISSLDDANNTIIIPNLKVNPNQEIVISFRARINYFDIEGETIFTEPELEDQHKQSVIKASKKEIKAHKSKAKQAPAHVLRKKEADQ